MEHAAPDLSPLALVLAADPVVKGVMLLVVLASLACWAILIDKLARIAGLRRAAARLERHVASPGWQARGIEGLGRRTLEAGLREAAESDPNESRVERRARIERAMREEVAGELRAAEPGLPFLATIGSAAPFIGLFGTVWGIMRSFIGIAASNDTSLAVVAPGIAEALLATGLSLVAAIPAVMAYNKLATDLGRLAQRLEAVIGRVGAGLAREARPAACRTAA